MEHSPATRSAGPATAISASEPDTIDLFGLYNLIVRRFLTILAVGSVVFFGVILFTLQQVPRFTATASVSINVAQPDASRMDEIFEGLPLDSTVVDTQVEHIRSRVVAERVVRTLDLTRDPEFNPNLREPSGFDRFKAQLRSFLRGSSPVAQASEVRGPVLPEAEREQRVIDATVSTVLGNLDVYRVGRTLMLNVTYSSEQPGRANAIANAFAEQYIEAQREAKREAANAQNRSLESRINELREVLRASEAAVEAYRIEHNLQPTRGTTLVESQLAELSAELIRERAELAEAEARLSSVRVQAQRGAADSVSEVLSSTLIGELRGQQAEVARDLAELSSRYGPLHPQIQRVNSQLSDIDAQIQAEVRRIVSSLETDVTAARQGIRTLEAGIEELRNELNQANQNQLELNELLRQADADRELYDLFLERSRETGEQGELSEADATIVSRAIFPGGPTSPRLTVGFLIAVVLGGGMALAAALLVELLDRGLWTGRDVEKFVGVRSLGTLPLVRRRAGIVSRHPGEHVVEKPMSVYADALRRVSASLRLARGVEPPQIVGVTSAMPGEGKSATALAISRVTVSPERPTLVVDCDLRRSGLTKATRLTSRNEGIVSVCLGETALDDAIVKDEHTALDILPVGKVGPSGGDVFSSRAFGELLAELRQRYAFIVLDCPPTLAVAESTAIAASCDAAVMIVETRKTSRDAAKAALAHLQNVNVNIAGAVLNKARLRARGRAATDQYYYYNKLKSYYRT